MNLLAAFILWITGNSPEECNPLGKISEDTNPHYTSKEEKEL